MGIPKAITCILDNTADIRAILKDFGLTYEERKTEITMKTECRKNGPIICKDLHLVTAVCHFDFKSVAHDFLNDKNLVH